MPFYFDDSIHRRGDFVLGAFAFGPDPTDQISAALVKARLNPRSDEFKSSSRMSEHPEQQILRDELRQILGSNYRLAVVLVGFEERASLGHEALLGLRKICAANGLLGDRQSAFFDEGLFATRLSAMKLATATGVIEHCDIHAEQDSKVVKGIQLADLVAHTCATMLLDSLGLVSKTVKAGPNSGCDPDLDIELGFELWTTVRYQFFCRWPKEIQSNEDMEVDVAPYGLHIAESCSATVREAAMARFGKQYVGCIH